MPATSTSASSPSSSSASPGSRTTPPRPRRHPVRTVSVVLVVVGLVLGCFGALLGLAHRAASTDVATLVVLLAALVATTAGCVLMELLDQRVTRAAALPATRPSWAWSLGLVGLLLLGGGLAAAPALVVVGLVVTVVAVVIVAARSRGGAVTRRSTVTLLESVGLEGPLQVERQHVARGSQRVYLRRDGVLVADTVVPTLADADALEAAAAAQAV